jgi:hypothetical protein
MIKYLLVILFLIISSISLLAQQGKDSISVLKNELESFNYADVITHADRMILHKETLSKATMIEIYRMKATAQFSLSDLEGADTTINEILSIDTTYVLDSSNTSPKIITYFNQLKQNYLSVLAQKKREITVKTDTVFVKDESTFYSLKQAVIRSVIFPGLGHLYLNQNLKGITLTSLTAVTLSSMIYFIIDSNKKQSNYLNVRDDVAIQSNYNNYNSSYKLRTYSIIAFAAVWLYSQIDLLFFPNINLPFFSGSASPVSGSLQAGFIFTL